MPEASTSQPFIEAFEAGLSPIPVDTTTKRPLVTWKIYQDHPAELIVLQEWRGNNIGVICGEVSGRLMCIDIEGAFDRATEAAEALARAGVADVFAEWCDGYLESTPSGGRHVLVRLEGSGPLEGNRKLASNSVGKTLIETRGEGGYVITAPSRNGSAGWSLLRGGFDTIAYATLTEWEAVVGALVSLDESPPPPTPTVESRSTPSLPPILRLSESWIDDELARLPNIRTVLNSHGWEPGGGHDSYGEHWVRPGKTPREGHSASISANDRLYVHSSNAGLHVGLPTYDALDVILFYDLGRDPTLEDRTAFLRAQRPPAERGAGAAEPEPVADLNLRPEFWESRDYLSHIRSAALARRLSPDALWEAIKCFYASSIPWNHRLPGDGTMDYISIVVGPSGSGKSRAKQEAYNLLVDLHSIGGVRFPAPVGSGEGMTQAYLAKDDADGGKYAFRGIGWYADEAKFVLDICARPGNTTMQAIKQMWSGELTGSVAATAERHRWLDPRDVRGTLLMSVTPGVATRFLASDLTDEGLPQRVSWGWAVYEHEDDRPEHPGPLHVPIRDHNRAPNNIYEVTLDPELEQLVDARQLALARGKGEGLEGHATYATLKTAAIHAHLDGRMDVNMSDWVLSELDWEQTRQIRQHLLATADAASQDRNQAAGIARAHSRIAETDVYLERAIYSLVTKLRSTKEPLTTRQVKDHLRPFKQRHGIDHREVIVLAIGRGLATEDGGIIDAV
jgi:hypothetical protein